MIDSAATSALDSLTWDVRVHAACWILGPDARYSGPAWGWAAFLRDRAARPVAAFGATLGFAAASEAALRRTVAELGQALADYRPDGFDPASPGSHAHAERVHAAALRALDSQESNALESVFGFRWERAHVAD